MKKNIIFGLFRHETNSFNPVPTTLKDYQARHALFGQEVIDFFGGTGTEMGAAISVFEGDDRFNLIPTVAFDALPAGPVAAEVVEIVRKGILDGIASVDHVDGVLLCIHGAMVTEVCDDGEGDLLTSIREAVGPDVPIITTLDLHTNMTKRMMNLANAFFPYHHYPHIDYIPRGKQAAQCMVDTLENGLKPVMAYCKLPLLLPYTPTQVGPMAEIEQWCRALEAEHDSVLNISICQGFFSADMSESGCSVVVVTDNDKELAQKLADQIGDRIWADRDLFPRKMYSVDEAIDEVLAAGDGFYCFADVCDNPGAGGTQDTTHILRGLIDRQVKGAVVAAIADAETVDQAIKAGVGATIQVKLGAKDNDEISGAPIEGEAYVRLISDGAFTYKGKMKTGMHGDMGKTVVLVIGGVEVIVTEKRLQTYDPEVMKAHGINPEERIIVVVKSTLHYRSNYTNYAKKLFDINVPGLAPQDPKQLKERYRLCQRPIYPLDPETEFVR